jgi:cobalamin-dependent methionine synthase I
LVCPHHALPGAHKRGRWHSGQPFARGGRRAWGILRQRHRGSRYSFGYPACPELEDRAKLVQLLEPERIGVTLSEELQLHPEQSTDALVVHHPEAKYFNAG